MHRADIEAKARRAVLVQNTAFGGYEKIPKYIVDSYSTILMDNVSSCRNLMKLSSCRLALAFLEDDPLNKLLWEALRA